MVPVRRLLTRFSVSRWGRAVRVSGISPVRLLPERSR